MCMTPSGTALDIFNAIDRCITLFDVPWSNCVAVGVDNTNVNMGNRHSIKTMVQEKNPDVFFNGCQCHVVHNTSAAAASAFTEATGFDVSDILVDLYYWFDHSSKRKNLLVEYSGFCDQEYRQVIKYASTRWLSLEKCVTRALQQNESLKSYFLSEKSSQARFKRLQAAFQDLSKGAILYTKSADNLIWILYKLDDSLLLMMVLGWDMGYFSYLPSFLELLNFCTASRSRKRWSFIFFMYLRAENPTGPNRNREIFSLTPCNQVYISVVTINFC